VIRSRIPRVFLVLAAAASLAGLACSDDPAPKADAEVRVETQRFFPAQLFIARGDQVRWVNVLRRDAGNVRTVTSGTGPDDPEAGELFDVSLQGFATGEIEGESTTYTFNEAGTYTYFSREPQGQEFTGTVRVD
jgi:plastocyanin